MFQVRAYEARTITWWYQRRNSIEFAPPFQRSGKLWSKADKAYLIDSILNEYDFPKLYLADFSYAGSELNKTNKQFAIIDGRQRLEAIFGFIEDEFPLADDFVFEADVDVDLKGLTYSQIRLANPKLALIFEQFNLPVMSVITDDEAKINQLFVRMNRNKPLTGAEIRNAMKGAVPPAIRSIADHPFFTTKCSFPTNRGQDRNVAAKLLLLSHSKQFVNTKKSDLDSFVKRFEEASSTPADLESARQRALGVLSQLEPEFVVADPKLRASGLIPVYFRVVEEHGAKGFGEFLTLWTSYAAVNEHILQDTTFVDDVFKSRLRLFQLLKRNVNDSASMQRLFAILSVEFARYRVGHLKQALAGIPRIKSRQIARKRLESATRAEQKQRRVRLV